MKERYQRPGVTNAITWPAGTQPARQPNRFVMHQLFISTWPSNSSISVDFSPAADILWSVIGRWKADGLVEQCIPYFKYQVRRFNGLVCQDYVWGWMQYNVMNSNLFRCVKCKKSKVKEIIVRPSQLSAFGCWPTIRFLSILCQSWTADEPIVIVLTFRRGYVCKAPRDRINEYRG